MTPYDCAKWVFDRAASVTDVTMLKLDDYQKALEGLAKIKERKVDLEASIPEYVSVPAEKAGTVSQWAAWVGVQPPQVALLEMDYQTVPGWTSLPTQGSGYVACYCFYRYSERRLDAIRRLKRVSSSMQRELLELISQHDPSEEVRKAVASLLSS